MRARTRTHHSPPCTHTKQHLVGSYDPDAPAGARFDQLARSHIARMYHSNAVLTSRGDVIIHGSNRVDKFESTQKDQFDPSPYSNGEHRIQVRAAVLLFCVFRAPRAAPRCAVLPTTSPNTHTQHCPTRCPTPITHSTHTP